MNNIKLIYKTNSVILFKNLNLNAIKNKILDEYL